VVVIRRARKSTDMGQAMKQHHCFKGNEEIHVARLMGPHCLFLVRSKELISGDQWFRRWARNDDLWQSRNITRAINDGNIHDLAPSKPSAHPYSKLTHDTPCSRRLLG
jgi:hypothetical protein